MVTDNPVVDLDYTDDILGNFSVDEYVLENKGDLSEKKVRILNIDESGVTVRDKHGQEYTVNVLRLSKL